MRHSLICQVTLAAGVLCAGVNSLASTRTLDFENLAVGTVVTTQYPGVTFSAQPQSCGGTPPVNLVIETPGGGTSSGTRGLGVTPGCPDFSPDYIRIVFDQLQNEVTFTVGPYPGTYQVRAYTAAGALLSTQNVSISGTGYAGVHRLVRVTSVSVNIKRIEIDEVVDNSETIDDLTFACPDSTPPQVQISSPLYESCACDSGVTIRGLSCDPEGFDHDTLEYLAVNAAAGTPWTLVDSATTPQCTAGGALYYWNTTGITEGCYYLRITSYNDCGATSSATTVVCVDRTVDTPTVRSPVDAAILGGNVCIDGTVWDGANAACLASYRVDYRVSGGATWSPVNPATPVYSTAVVNDPLANWDTPNVLPVVKDGTSQLRVRATNTCGANSADVIRTVVIDNTPPTAVISEPLNCQMVAGVVTIRGTVNDEHMGSWVLQYTGGDATNWVEPPIASGNTSVLNGVLGTWNTTGLRRCSYSLRLLVTDTAVLDCVSTRHNQHESIMSVYVGSLGHFDYDSDTDVDMDDFGVFQRCFSGPGIPAALVCRN